MDKSLFNPSSWSGALAKVIGDIKDTDPIDQTDLRIVGAIGFVGGMAVQGNRANKRIQVANETGTPVALFKYTLV